MRQSIIDIIRQMGTAVSVDPAESKTEHYRPSVDGRCPACEFTGRFYADDHNIFGCRKCGKIIGTLDFIADKIVRNKKRRK